MYDIVFMPGKFLSTLSLRRATARILLDLTFHQHFYPRSPCGERRNEKGLAPLVRYFYPRSPCGERPTDACIGSNPDFISIHALLAESDLQDSGRPSCIATFLSTLSLRRATMSGTDFYRSAIISIHALLAESDWGPRWTKCRHPRFLSTLSLRRATSRCHDYRPHLGNFYPRSPCGERHSATGPCSPDAHISIHALLAESDGEVFASKPRRVLFLSTLSLRRATMRRCTVAGSCLFLSTLSLRRAT